MKRSKLMVLLGVSLVALLALAVTSIGSAAPAKKQATIKVALVTDIGGLDDKSFNMLANLGLKQAVKVLGVQGRVFICRSGTPTTCRTFRPRHAASTTSWSPSGSSWPTPWRWPRRASRPRHGVGHQEPDADHEVVLPRARS